MASVKPPRNKQNQGVYFPFKKANSKVKYDLCELRTEPTLLEKQKAIYRNKRSDDPENLLHKLNYAQHRRRVRDAKPFVDSSPPIICKNLYASPSNFNKSISNFVRIERENALMLERIAIIMKSPPTIDNRLKSSDYSYVSERRWAARELELRRIEDENLQIWNRLQKAAPVYDRQQMAMDYKIHERTMQHLSLYPLFWKVPYLNHCHNMKMQALENAKMNPRPLVYMGFETDEKGSKREFIIIELRADVVPVTAENFRCLCTGELGISYKCSKMDRIVKNLLWQGGDIIGRDGRAGKSIYGNTFPDENFKLKHDDVGVVSMVNDGKDTNGSQFMIAARPLPVLDGKQVVVGKVIRGMNFLYHLYKFKTPSGMMLGNIWIADCGSADYGLPAGYDEDNDEDSNMLPPSGYEAEEGDQGNEEDI